MRCGHNQRLSSGKILPVIEPLEGRTLRTAGVNDTRGVAFVPYKITFTTGSTPTGVTSIGFDHVLLPSTGGNIYTAVTKGPDGKLYAASLEGKIFRFTIKSDGTLGSPQVITTVQQKNGGNRYLIGLTFDA